LAFDFDDYCSVIAEENLFMHGLLIPIRWCIKLINHVIEATCFAEELCRDVTALQCYSVRVYLFQILLCFIRIYYIWTWVFVVILFL